MPKSPPRESSSRASSGQASETDWAVTLVAQADARHSAAALKRAGAEVVDVLAEIGVINVRATAAVAAGLRRLKDVDDVSPVPSADIGPPDTPIS